MGEQKQSKITIISSISILMSLFFIFKAPSCIDKSQDIVIKKLSGLSGFVEKEGKLRIDAGKRLLEITSMPQKFNIKSELTLISKTLNKASEKELKNPKLKGAAEILSKVSNTIALQAETFSNNEEIDSKLLSEKAQTLLGAGNKMIKKSARLMQMVSLRMYITSYWRGLIVFGGFFLLLSVYALRRNEPWAFPAIVTVLSLAPIGGFYISLAGAVFFGVANGFVVFGVGLLAFLIVLLLGLETKKEKVVYLSIMILLGMIGVDAFSFAEHGIRGLLAKPYIATVTEPAQSILRFTGPIALFTLITVLISIYMLASKKSSGWWFATISAMGIIAVGFPADWLRHKDSFFLFGFSMSTYMLGGILGVILLIVLILPYFRKEILPDK